MGRLRSGLDQNKRQFLIELEFCSRGDQRYKDMRSRHYIPDKGAHGQQLHFIIHNNNKQVGIISGGSSVYAVAARNDFFNFPKEKELKQKFWLPSIVNNTVFRIESPDRNLGTETLALWRRTTIGLWKELYGVDVIGFETFIIEEPWRRGSMYLADNWAHVGTTAGSTKAHGTGGLTESFSRESVVPKMIFCRWAKKPKVPTIEYKSSWRAETAEEKIMAKQKSIKRATLIGERYSKNNMM